ncbi:hypothetical protein Bca52824_048421 [Brassica carinata]|uniref:Replication factor A C-terminal domain-containing protein n=2 Tax=Brassica TaxID=3705 RepID=A0A8X7RIY0_BRACI|nr:hypothetical protein Bca52824_048421 [Brassica carinata]
MVVVYLSLWDDAASMFRGLISSGDRTQSVMVVTCTSTLPQRQNFISTQLYKLSRSLQPAFPCIDTKDGITKKEVVSIGELNKFITNSDEQTQEADFICKAQVMEVLQQNGWSLISCTGCSKKLDKFGSSLRCNRCANPNVTGVIKYRVELVVDDGDDNATFVVFDKEMVKVAKRDAASLALDEMNGDGSEKLMQCVKDFAGKEFVFKIRVTSFNFSPSHRTFIVSSIIDSIPPETFKTTEDEFVQVEGGEASASASKNVKGEANEPSPSSDGGAEGTRKRPHDLYLNSTAATKFYIGTNLPAIKDFTANLSGAVGQDSPILHDDTVITNKQLTSIGDLNMFLSKPTDQEPYFISKARIVEVLTQNGWHYVSCNHCGKKLDNSAASLPCNQCLHANASGVARYSVELLVDDGNNYATFLVFNKEMLKLIKQDAATLLHDEVNGGVCNILPQCLAELEEQAFVFHVHVTPHNFTPNTPTFTVSGIRDNTNTEINETASVQVKYGNQQLWYLPATRQQMRSKKVDAHTQGSERFKAIQT